MKFSVATYNIHKGFSHLTRRMVIHELKEKLHGLSADLLFLQEVQGVNDRHAGRYRDWPGKPQHEFIADTMWREVAYGRNATYRHGHHGNALLSRYPIVAHENEDISAHAFETRGLLHCEIKLGEKTPALHCLNVHLGLFERGRQWQIRALVDRIRETVPHDAPMIIAGDFNDWRRKADRTLTDELGIVRGLRGSEGPARAHVPVGAPDVSPGPNLCARPQRGRRPRPLRVSQRPHVRSRGARGYVRGTAQAPITPVDESLHAGQQRRVAAQRWRILSGARRRDRRGRTRSLARNLHLRRRRGGPRDRRCAHSRGATRRRSARAGRRLGREALPDQTARAAAARRPACAC